MPNACVEFLSCQGGSTYTDTCSLSNNRKILTVYGGSRLTSNIMPQERAGQPNYATQDSWAYFTTLQVMSLYDTLLLTQTRQLIYNSQQCQLKVELASTKATANRKLLKNEGLSSERQGPIFILYIRVCVPCRKQSTSAIFRFVIVHRAFADRCK